MSVAAATILSLFRAPLYSAMFLLYIWFPAYRELAQWYSEFVRNLIVVGTVCITELSIPPLLPPQCGL